MVREIVHVQVGQCGMSAEHKLAKDSNFTGNKDDAEDARKFDKIDAYFTEDGELRSVLRAILVDLEAGSLDVVKASLIGTMFKSDNFVFGASGANNNWAKEAESCDCVDNHPDRITATFSAPKVSDVVAKPDNETLRIHQLLENRDEVLVIDNEALYNISHNIC